MALSDAVGKSCPVCMEKARYNSALNIATDWASQRHLPVTSNDDFQMWNSDSNWKVLSPGRGLVRFLAALRDRISRSKCFHHPWRGSHLVKLEIQWLVPLCRRLLLPGRFSGIFLIKFVSECLIVKSDNFYNNYLCLGWVKWQKTFWWATCKVCHQHYQPIFGHRALPHCAPSIHPHPASALRVTSVHFISSV